MDKVRRIVISLNKDDDEKGELLIHSPLHGNTIHAKDQIL